MIPGRRTNQTAGGPTSGESSDGHNIVNVCDSGDDRVIVDRAMEAATARSTSRVVRKGPQGEKGDKGDPGEVSAANLNFAFDNTNANSNTVQPLDTTGFSDPPTLSNLLAVANKLNELINALSR